MVIGHMVFTKFVAFGSKNAELLNVNIANNAENVDIYVVFGQSLFKYRHYYLIHDKIT